MKKICILGSTGSIGINTLEIIRQHPAHFKVEILAINRNIKLLQQQISKFKPVHIVIFDRNAYEKFRLSSSHHNISIGYGLCGLNEALAALKPDLLVNAFVGFAGLQPTINAIRQGIDIALANKETLVVAGALVRREAARYHVKIIPIDSEHSAIWQCLQGEDINRVQKLILTASGGPFLGMSGTELHKVKAKDALKHPNWKMGKKITIDSATLMNKGFEVIEAHWLYQIPPDRIEVVIHQQSIIHSMVMFIDSSVKAQLGLPDMRIPIQYALTYPDRFKLQMTEQQFNEKIKLTFESPDMKKFPCLAISYNVLNQGQTFPVVLNAANEVAVEAFLQDKIRFTDIPALIQEQLDQHQPKSGDDLDDIIAIDKEVRERLDYLF